MLDLTIDSIKYKLDEPAWTTPEKANSFLICKFLFTVDFKVLNIKYSIWNIISNLIRIINLVQVNVKIKYLFSETAFNYIMKLNKHKTLPIWIIIKSWFSLQLKPFLVAWIDLIKKFLKYGPFLSKLIIESV